MLIFAVPLYNFGVSQHFKTWWDIVGTDPRSAPGSTTLTGKPAFLVTARGGGYGPGTPREGWDHATGWMRRVLADVWGLDLDVIETELTLAEVTRPWRSCGTLPGHSSPSRTTRPASEPGRSRYGCVQPPDPALRPLATVTSSGRSGTHGTVTFDPAPQPRDASEVGSSVARVAWAEAARPVLLEAAGRYRATVTYKQLAAAVQESTGITTTQLMHQWIGDVLGIVTDECQSRGEPLLSALCVSVQGSVGEGYADAVEHARGSRPTDPDDHAAHERLSCYRHWQATGLPRDGGTPLRTAHFKTVRKAGTSKRVPRAAAPRATPSRKSIAPPTPEPKPIPLCPRCFTQVPASGVCDYCD